jgi:hypothetical protein
MDMKVYNKGSIIEQLRHVERVTLSLTRASQTNNFVASKAYYDISFRTATAGVIKSIVMDFPAGTSVGSALIVEATGIGPGTLAASAGEVLTYTVTNAVSVPALTNIRIQISNINNPATPSASFILTVQTRNPANAIINGPTATSAYNIVQVGNAQIAPGAVTTTKIATGAVTTGDITDGAVRPQVIERVGSVVSVPSGERVGGNTFCNIFASEVAIGGGPFVSPGAEPFLTITNTGPLAVDQWFTEMYNSDSAPGEKTFVPKVICMLPMP